MILEKWFKQRTVEELPAMRRYARSLVGGDDADDLVHEALLRAYEAHRTFRKDANLRHWLFAILHNCFVDGWRRSRVEERSMAHLATLAATHSPANQEYSAELDLLNRAFAALPAEQREVLHLVVVEGLSYQGTASILDVPVGTVMSRLSRARAQLGSSERAKRPGLKIVGGNDKQPD